MASIELACPIFQSVGTGQQTTGKLDRAIQFDYLATGADTVALLHGSGTATTRTANSVADKNFMGYWLEHSATSGDNRGLYLRTYFTGAGGGGEAARIFSTVQNVAAGTVHGAHISLSLGASGSLTGQGIAMRGTLHMPTTALPASNVTYSAVQAEIYSDGSASDPSGNLLSAVRVINDGNATGMADVDDDAAMLHLVGWTDATGNLLYGSTLRIRVATTNRFLVMSSAEDSLTWLATDGRIDLSAMTVGAGNTDGGVIKCGTASARVIEDTADMRFLNFNFDNGATSGDNRGMYLRLYLTGAGGGGEAARIFTTVENVAGGTAHGAHISLSLGASGSLTGQGVAMRGTLHMPTTALPASNVTYAAVQAEVYSDGANSDPTGNLLSAVRIINDGNATGMADVDDDCAAIEFVGWGSGTGNMVYVHTITTPGAAAASVRVRVAGTNYYAYLWAAEGS